ncbi:hypothetical protein HOE37_03505 [Candidatus Woesearchaeota archaeon]|jgi:hypothetical protein|nr:hypothetical protein [Candidatus Woesearchaeota archaeon]MBT4110897.1 hypothetical protein [Candidatus Woesearchaeota archaeon]MBT4336591.1 hypothetical protein [Candidatus Woesearchaeota archaeon]MBT4469660.1 hypothetical protein [Candidatus Woesearchaeota archaeon]MBT6744022.1 hypothetical protein [Candidatus Woesearchaeota archaeon]
MGEKKVYLVDSSRVGEKIAGSLRLASDETNIPIELRVSHQLRVDRLPRDYDLYVLHLSNVGFDDVRQLKEEQPWSYFIAISRGGGPTPTDIKNLFDKNLKLVYVRQLEDALRSINGRTTNP